MKEEQKYNGSKTRNYFTAYLLASIRGKRLRYLEKQQKILFAEENLEDKEYTDADISPEERLELEQKEQLLMEEAQGIYPEWNEMTDISLIEAMFSLQEEERKLIYQHVFEERTFKEILVEDMEKLWRFTLKGIFICASVWKNANSKWEILSKILLRRFWSGWKK